MFFANLFRKSDSSKALDKIKEINKEEELKNEVNRLNEQYKEYLHKMCYDKSRGKIFGIVGFELNLEKEICLVTLSKENVENNTFNYITVDSIKWKYHSVDAYLLLCRIDYKQLQAQLKALGFNIVKIGTNNESK